LWFDSRFAFADPPPVEFSPRKFMIGVLLQQDYKEINPPQTHIPRKYQYLTPEEFYAADIQLQGTFGSKDHEAVHRKILNTEFHNKTVECNLTAFMILQKNIAEILVDVLDSPSETLNLVYEADISAQDDTYIACRDYFFRLDSNSGEAHC